MRLLTILATLLCLLLLADGPRAEEKTATEAIQEALIWTNYYEGPLDGKMGEGTIAAIKRFQKDLAADETGTFTGSQLDLLLNRASEIRNPFQFTIISDDATGSAIGLPLVLVPNKQSDPHGSDYVSADKSLTVGLRRYRTTTPLSKLFESLRKSLEETQIDYSVQRANWFVLSGGKGAMRYYIRVHRREAEVASFFVFKEQVSQPEVPLSMMSFTFRPFSARPIESIRKAPRVSAIELEGPLAALKRSTTEFSNEVRPSTDVTAVNTSNYLLMEEVKKALIKSGGVNINFYTYILDKNELPSLLQHVPILRILFNERVFFDTGKADLRPDAQIVLDAIARSLREQKQEGVLFVAGHTDARGSDEYNIDLSVRRASNVAEQLSKRGVGGIKIWKVGFGRAVPLRPNDSDINMSYNRRVEFLLSTQSEVIATWIARHSQELCTDGPAKQECRGISGQKQFTALPIMPPNLMPLPPTFVSPPVIQNPRSSIRPSPPSAKNLRTQSIERIEINLETKRIEVGAPSR